MLNLFLNSSLKARARLKIIHNLIITKITIKNYLNSNYIITFNLKKNLLKFNLIGNKLKNVPIDLVWNVDNHP